jgi:hypothetical protein
MKLKTAIPSIAAALLAAAPFASAQNATTDPVGFVTVNITAGTGLVKTVSLISAPLLEAATVNGAVSGVLTGVTANTLSNSAAGWTSGQLSQAATPYLIQLTSGNASGQMFLVSTTVNNTSDTITISAADQLAFSDLVSIGVAPGDSYKLWRCETLLSFLGTPADGVQGGSSAATADTVSLCLNGSVNEYFYNTSNSKWVINNRSLTDSDLVPIRPDAGIRYARLSNTPLSLTVPGNVPTTSRKVEIKNSGPTYLSQFWPVNSTLSSLNLQNLSNWTSGATAATADTVIIYSNGSFATYFYNGTNWVINDRSLTPSNDVVIPLGASVIVNQRGSELGSSVLSQSIPYNL